MRERYETNDLDAVLSGDGRQDERDRYRAALERLANPTSVPKTEEAALLQIEVQQIAREALDG